MRNFWRGAAVNTTGPTAFQGQASGHWTLGNLYLRAPVRSEQIATVNLPSFRAGCGGIDAFAGAFSFIDSDQLIAFGRAVAQNAVGFAFELALETISPVIAETMAKLRALAQWDNDRNLNSCETAQALVGAVWSKNDRASAAICAAIGTSQGIFSDYAAAKHGCGSEGTPEEQAEIERLEARQAELAETDDDSWTEELLAEAETIETRLDEIEGGIEARAVYRREDFGMAGCLVTVAHDGTLQVVHGLVKPEDMPKQPESGDTDTETGRVVRLTSPSAAAGGAVSARTASTRSRNSPATRSRKPRFAGTVTRPREGLRQASFVSQR